MSTTEREALWPERGTPEAVLWSAAMEVALAAPAKQNPTASSAQIPWVKIDALREAIEGVGIDWAAFKQDHDSAARQRAQRKGDES
jgi:hypothetical protein